MIHGAIFSIIRKVNIHGDTYYVYDLPSDKTGKQKRLYDRSKSKLEEHIQKYEKLHSSLMQEIVEDAVTFSDLYSCFLAGSMSLQQRELYSSYEPLISSLLAVDLSEITKSVILQFLQDVAPERSDYAIESLGKILNNVLRFASERRKLPNIYITAEDIDAINKAKIQREPVYCLENYERVFLKLQQKTKRNADRIMYSDSFSYRRKDTCPVSLICHKKPDTGKMKASVQKPDLSALFRRYLQSQ